MNRGFYIYEMREISDRNLILTFTDENLALKSSTISSSMLMSVPPTLALLPLQSFENEPNSQSNDNSLPISYSLFRIIELTILTI